MTEVMGRVQIIEGTPPLLPGNCALCGSVDKPAFIDTMWSMKRYGRIYYCIECFDEIASAVGWLSPANAELIQTTYDETIAENTKLKEDNARLVDVVGLSIPNLLSDLSYVQAAIQGPGFPVKKPVGRPKGS